MIFCAGTSMRRRLSTNAHDIQQNKRARDRRIERFQNTLHIKFKNKSLLVRALTHRSFVNEHGGRVPDNERLEYLGDSVLALVVNEYLFKHFEEYQEGRLAKIKAAVVSEASLAAVARRLGIGEYIFLGRGEEQTGGRSRSSILANTLEAIIGAIYLDAGLKACKKFVLGIIKDEISAANAGTGLRDPKTTLQEYVQKKYRDCPVYEVIGERGPDHRKEFIVRLIIKGRELAVGEGPSKRKAESNAAEALLKQMEKGEIDL